MTVVEPMEVPVSIPTEHGHLFGIRSEPATPSPVGALVLPANGNAFGGRTRFALRLSRQLASAGLRTLRIDYRGTGESGGGVERLSAATPAINDAAAAARALEACGHEDIVLIGYCYGSRVALAVAREIPAVRSVVLISPPVEPPGRRAVSATGVARGALQPARWRALRYRSARLRYWRVVRNTVQAALRRNRVGDEVVSAPSRPVLVTPFIDGMVALAEAEIPTLLLLGSLDRSLSSIQRAANEQIDALLTPGASSVELSVIPGAIHGLRDEAAEDAAIACVTAWATNAGAGS